MSRPEWLRTFAEIYRSGSVTAAAAARAISQPAASQQLRSLERVVGEPLFRRTRDGVVPTDRGRELFAAVADPLDRLEAVLDGLDAGRVPRARRPLRVGASAEAFAGLVLPALSAAASASPSGERGSLDAPSGWTVPIDALFGDDETVLAALVRHDLDLALTNTPAPRRSAISHPAGAKEFALVGAPAMAKGAPLDARELGRWLSGRPWVSYSVELPITRRFWSARLGCPFAGDLRLAAPDLRVVAAAVGRGLGFSLLPRFACDEGLAAGEVVELLPVGDTVPPEPWFVCVRHGAGPVGRDDLVRLLIADASVSRRLTPSPSG